LGHESLFHAETGHSMSDTARHYIGGLLPIPQTRWVSESPRARDDSGWRNTPAPDNRPDTVRTKSRASISACGAVRALSQTPARAGDRTTCRRLVPRRRARRARRAQV